jgi:hypothetical protein
MIKFSYMDAVVLPYDGFGNIELYKGLPVVVGVMGLHDDIKSEVCWKPCPTGDFPVGYVINIIDDHITALVIKTIITTDNYDTEQRYPVNADLFINAGKLSTKEPKGFDGEPLNTPAKVVGTVFIPPSVQNSELQYLQI